MQNGSPREEGQTQVLILAGAVLLIAVAGGIFYLGRLTAPKPQNVATSSPQPSPLSTEASVKVEDETASWKIYTNTTFKYQLKYPNGYEVLPQIDRLKSQLGVDQDICITKKWGGGIDCKLLVNVFSVSQYKLIDNSGGFIFYFDVNKKQWLHDKTNQTSQFVPKRANSSFEAYTYKTGDVKCSAELILIPNSNYTSLVEIRHTICRDDEGNPLEGSSDISSDQILSTFRFLP